MKLIGLHGPARCGKDTVAWYLTKYHGYEQAAFAGPVKRMIESLLGMHPNTLEEMKDQTLSHLGCTPRVLLQTLGTEWGRDIVGPRMSPGSGLWVRMMEERLDLMEEFGMYDVVITDVRFQDEADFIHRLGGVVVHVRREDRPTIATPDHASEQGITFDPKRDFKLANTTTKEDLKARVEVLADMVEADCG